MHKFTSHCPSLTVHVYPDGVDKELTIVQFEDGVYETSDPKIAKALAAVEVEDIGGIPFVVESDSKGSSSKAPKSSDSKGSSSGESLKD